MNPLQNWMRGFLVWMFCSCCLSLLCFASPVPLKGAHTPTNHSCTLSKNYFQRTYIKNRTYTLAKQARLFDKDTDNRFVGQQLYINIKENNHCYLMKRVTDIVMTNALSELKNQSSTLQEVADFLAHLNVELSHCKPLGDKEHIENNLKQMKDKLDQLGENGKNKAVGELDLLFDYLENACTKAPKKMRGSQRGNKKL
ncbi:interleukin-22 [Elgaria multicarinata webbii]|uniref:interleukin-22 n=1 Tax=Elgaria multicarinata webbii TaxID=159646 RepID=UPI002FCD44ED